MKLAAFGSLPWLSRSWSALRTGWPRARPSSLAPGSTDPPRRLERPRECEADSSRVLDRLRARARLAEGGYCRAGLAPRRPTLRDSLRDRPRE